MISKTNITYGLLVGVHVLMGVMIYLNESLAKIVFLGAFGIFMYRIILAPVSLKTFEILKAASYFVGAEVLFRMTKGSFSYEAGKYVVILLMLLGMLYKGLNGNGWPYALYIIFLIPSIFVASTTLSFDANFRNNIAFVLSGPICLGVASLFCYDRKVTRKQINDILLLMVLPIIAHTAYIYLYNPTVKDVLEGTASNRASSGGWGANQVSTVLGLGMFLIAVNIFMRSKTFGLKILNIVLFVAISYRALVTFSRGGVLTALICIAVFLFTYFVVVDIKRKNQVILTSLVFAICIAGTWIYSINQTDGLISLRYENKDHLGRDKGSVTTGRIMLFQGELNGFISQPFFGIGSSRAKDQRSEIEGQGVTSHSEFSRTLAEHGILGVAMLLILIFKPLAFRSTNRKNIYFFSFLGFWFLTINHSSMRIAAPAFVYALALLNVTNEKNPVHRKLPVKRKA